MYRFNISQPTVSRMFKKWMMCMGEKLAPLIHWPSQNEIKKHCQWHLEVFSVNVSV